MYQFSLLQQIEILNNRRGLTEEWFQQHSEQEFQWDREVCVLMGALPRESV